MDAVVVEPEADQERVHAEQSFEIGADRNRGARADQQSVLAPLLGEGAAHGGELRHSPVERDRRRAGMADEFGLAIGRQAGTHEGAERDADLLGLLAAHEAERYLGGSFQRDHGLRPLARIAAPYAVDVAGRPRRQLLDQATVFLARWHAQADRTEKTRGRDVERGPLRHYVGGQLAYAVVESRDCDLAIVVVNDAEDFRQHPDRVLRRAAEHAGMQVAIGSLDLDLVIDEPP